MAEVSPLPRPRGRPPKPLADFNDRSDTRSALIRIGLRVLSERGWDATGIAAVLDEAGIPKGSFYHYFASKDEFGLAVIDAYATYFEQRLAHTFADAALPARERIARFIDTGRAGLKKYAYKRGCIVGNLAQELSGSNEAFRARLEAVVRRWESVLAACLKDGIAAGELAPTLDAAATARFFWIGWEGAVLRAKLARSVAPVNIFAAGFFALLDAA